MNKGSFAIASEVRYNNVTMMKEAVMKKEL